MPKDRRWSMLDSLSRNKLLGQETLHCVNRLRVMQFWQCRCRHILQDFSKQKPGMCSFDTCGRNRSEIMLGHCCLDRSQIHYNWRPRSVMMRRRICSNSAFVIIPLLRSMSKASTRLSELVVRETSHSLADTAVEREPLCGSFTACSKKGEIEFDVHSSNTHIVIAWWQVGIADVLTCADQIVSTSRFGL